MLDIKLNHKKFKSFKVKIHTIGITSQNTDRVDLGELHLSANGRNYQLTFGTQYGCVQDNIIDMDIEIEDLILCRETFEDCEFDLLESDLTDPSLSATFHLSSDTVKDSSVYCLMAELIYDNIHIKVKQDNSISNENIEYLELIFTENIVNDVDIDIGGMTLENPRTGHQFTLDVIQSYRTDNTIECKLQCIAEMIVDSSYGTDCPMDLQLSELHENGLICEIYPSGISDSIFKEATLHTVNNETGKTKKIMTCLME